MPRRNEQDDCDGYLGTIAADRQKKPAARRPASDHPRQRRGRQARPWRLARVVRACWAAPAVFLALLELAADKALCTPTRLALCKATGITRAKTISVALTTLETAGWIERAHVPVTVGGRRTATLLRIVIRKGRVAPSTVCSAVRGAWRPKGKGRVAPLDSL